MKILWSLFVFWMLASTAVAQQPIRQSHNPYDGESTLDHYLKRAEWVVVGTFKNSVVRGMGVSEGPISTPDHPALRALGGGEEIEVQEIIKGGALPGRNLIINLCYWYVDPGLGKPVTEPAHFPVKSLEQPADPASLQYQKGVKYVFFLQTIPADREISQGGKRLLLETVDPWFGVFPYSEAFALALRNRRVAEASP